jgi:predicted enzyme related to lactoylglutathione lyase
MNFSKIIPLITTSDLGAVKAFYTEHFGFRATIEAPGYLGLKSIESPHLELGFMRPDNPNCPVFDGKGVTLNLEVADVDEEYDRLTSLGVRTEGPPADHPWGDRSFQVMDPAGIALYISNPIPPAPEFKKYFTE